ncbi:MAG: bifunctional folylpolyglutamate synthase/dihydrofolate synthase [Bacteroidales bacterium]|nr:bifunctional folylpolyglutamate synthase/dihydrofolate synthase [Bacteroidales bacterium]
MTYQEKIEKLFSRHPSFQKVGGAAYKPGLDTMMALDALTGHPHRRLSTIHVAGTNGKGSVSSLLAAALSCGHRRIGLYTSPHLTDFRERIKIVTEDGFEMIPREAVEAFLDRYDAFMEEAAPSFFEITTALAFSYFAQAGVDLAVIECGLGGRLDSTNIITPLVSVITNIGLEHCTYLGDTLEQIAFEKAGIIKPGVPAVVGEINPATRPVFEAAAAERGCELVFAPEHESSIEVAESEMDLPGEYQRQNIATVKAALDALHSVCPDVPFDTSRLARAASLTGLRGRWEKLSSAPDIICDIGHNAHGLRRVFDQLRAVAPQYGHIFIVFGVVSDKDVDAIAPLMIAPGEYVSYIFTQPSTDRAMPVGRLTSTLAGYGISGDSRPTVAEAIAAAQAAATPADLIFIGGSNFTVSDAVAATAPNP